MLAIYSITEGHRDVVHLTDPISIKAGGEKQCIFMLHDISAE